MIFLMKYSNQKYLNETSRYFYISILIHSSIWANTFVNDTHNKTWMLTTLTNLPSAKTVPLIEYKCLFLFLCVHNNHVISISLSKCPILQTIAIPLIKMNIFYNISIPVAVIIISELSITVSNSYPSIAVCISHFCN